MRLTLLALVILAGLAVALGLDVVRRIAPRHHERWLPVATKAWSALSLRALGIAVEVRGEPCPGGALLVCNHVSWVDALVLGAQCGSGFVAKAEVADWPVLGRLAACAEVEFVRRGDAESARRTMQRIARRLSAGRRVMLFPEGTTGDGARVLPFRRRLLTPAVQVAALVQPAALAYRGPGRAVAPYLAEHRFLTHLVRTAAHPGLAVTLAFGPTRVATVDARRLATVLEAEVVKLHRDLVQAPAA